MPRPEGYRKALRLMRLAEKFRLPIFTFIDTPGAYPGIGAEERGQSEAIARNLYVMAELKTPIVCTIVGEGGSGGALAIGVGDRMMILQYSTYSVISPEGCASILWKSADKASVAAETLGITADRLKANGLVDRIVEEPLGGAQRDWDAMFQSMRRALTDTLAELRKPSLDALLGRALPASAGVWQLQGNSCQIGQSSQSWRTRLPATSRRTHGWCWGSRAGSIRRPCCMSCSRCAIDTPLNCGSCMCTTGCRPMPTPGPISARGFAHRMRLNPASIMW